MKKYVLFSLITTALISSAAMADRQDDLREELDLEGARVAMRAITNEYQVNWRKFDFTNPEDDQRATKVQNYLDAVLGSKSTKWYEKSANVRRETGDYQHPLCLQYSARGARYHAMQNTLSDSWSRALSGTLDPQDEVIDEGTSSSLASVPGSSHEGMLPSTSSMSTSPEMLFEQLDEKATKAVLRAITHKFQVEWEKFVFTNPEDDQRATKVHNYLDAVLKSKYMEWAEKSADIRRTNTDYLQDPNYMRYDAKYKKYYSMQSALNDSWSNALAPQ